MPFAGGVESRRRREAQVPQPLARSQSSTHSLRCSDGYTALQNAIKNKKADAAAYLRSLGALAIFHSLPALQLLDCTQMRHQKQQGRRYCIPSQYRRAGMTPPRPANRKRAVLPPRVAAAAACRHALGLRPLGPDDNGRHRE